MNIAFMKVTDDMLIEKLAGVAKDIWYEYFPSIISVEQIEYMLEKFQSTVAIEKQISTNRYQYYLMFNGREVLGYLGFKEEIKRLFLSKLYLKKEYRGKGYFSEMLSFIEHYAKQKGLKSMYLTVNKHNDHSISVYQKKGFVILEEKVVDIGKGFIMDDYVMEKQLVNI
jgi:ribosomal protein S18 acetylase RimI-like enzyme